MEEDGTTRSWVWVTSGLETTRSNIASTSPSEPAPGSRGGGGGGEGDQSRGFSERSGGGGKVNPLTRGGGGTVMG